jgi:hypothetical protein
MASKVREGVKVEVWVKKVRGTSSSAEISSSRAEDEVDQRKGREEIISDNL